MQSTRSKLVTRRTYCRPKPDGTYETWEEVCTRVRDHQEWLWTRAADRPLADHEQAELDELYGLMVERKALPSGRILWMGGTEQAKKTEIAMFNCSFLEVRDVYSAVDAFYLLLNGCGVGFTPRSGLLSGFSRQVKIDVVRSENEHTSGCPKNTGLLLRDENDSYIYHLVVGDSGVAWAKAFGKLLTMKHPVDEVVLDFSRIRKPGVQLSGYGWLSSGDEQIAEAFVKICEVLNKRADQLLTEIDILDIINLVGTTLTSRRSAEICMLESTNPQAEEFTYAKKDHFEAAPWRSQSNNTLVYYTRPSKIELRGLFATMLEAGGSEPGLYNGEAARLRAPWFAGSNPCGEILLPDGGLCNLVELNIGHKDFHEEVPGGRQDLFRAQRLITRANFRQTCVELKDGVLSDKWDETQKFLRLCGAGLTGIVQYLDRANGRAEWTLQKLGEIAQYAATSMADELGVARAKAVTTVKPSGTLGKLMDTTEGLHRPLGRYIFNKIKFSVHDQTVRQLHACGYDIMPDPYSKENVLVTIPVDNGPGKWTKLSDGRLINDESARVQLERYRLLMDNYVDHNASVTISYSPEEVSEIVDWLYSNWDSYVGVSFMLRTDPSVTAADMGYPYLPQEVVSEKDYQKYVNRLQPIDFEGGDMLELEECEGGACPIR